MTIDWLPDLGPEELGVDDVAPLEIDPTKKTLFVFSVWQDFIYDEDMMEDGRQALTKQLVKLGMPEENIAIIFVQGTSLLIGATFKNAQTP